MHVTILGDGPLSCALARLAERAGHRVSCTQAGAESSGGDDASDLVIVTSSNSAAESALASASLSKSAVVIDATTPIEREAGAHAEQIRDGRVVRAFASVPADAIAAVDNGAASDGPALAIPLAGDDRRAKALVGKFMREIGVEPFDLGALANASVISPGGALWGKALNPIEMLESVGWLSGDG